MSLSVSHEKPIQGLFHEEERLFYAQTHAFYGEAHENRERLHGRLSLLTINLILRRGGACASA
jgi:hypothetical protein